MTHYSRSEGIVAKEMLKQVTVRKNHSNYCSAAFCSLSAIAISISALLRSLCRRLAMRRFLYAQTAPPNPLSTLHSEMPGTVNDEKSEC